MEKQFASIILEKKNSDGDYILHDDSKISGTASKTNVILEISKFVLNQCKTKSINSGNSNSNVRNDQPSTYNIYIMKSNNSTKFSTC